MAQSKQNLIRGASENNRRAKYYKIRAPARKWRKTSTSY